MAKEICPCSRDCPDRKPNCHTIECPHGWYEWNERKLAKGEIEFARKAQRYDEIQSIRDAVNRNRRR